MWIKVSLILSVLMIFDGLFCMLFFEKFSHWMKNFISEKYIVRIAAFEIIGGTISAALIIKYCM
jgi:hypothetical protein